MTKKSRKPLSDALAQQFVYGEESKLVKGDALSATPPRETLDKLRQPSSMDPFPDNTQVSQQGCSYLSGFNVAPAYREFDARQNETSLPTESEQEVNSKTSSPIVEAAEPATNTKTESKKSSLMDKLQVESKEATTRFTVDLPNSMHRKLSILAAKTGRKKASIVRMLLDEALKDIKN